MWRDVQTDGPHIRKEGDDDNSDSGSGNGAARCGGGKKTGAAKQLGEDDVAATRGEG